MIAVIVWGLLGLGLFQLAKIIIKVAGIFFHWLRDRIKDHLNKTGRNASLNEKEVLSMLGDTLAGIMKDPDFTGKLKNSPKYSIGDLDKMTELLGDTVVIADYDTKGGTVENIEIGKAENTIDRATKKLHEDNGGFVIYAGT